ncbi:CLUMA_CG019909, isoform A [Clunio marinus]|uniref:CLUMA_CG019909, isoform A n=1 Tax=Clunio marinus TaxID=568069 RepID=A0A1J1J5P3_9DIPT|nr:CLUMA_CG019909, isoform A [Clunio marinus]
MHVAFDKVHEKIKICKIKAGNSFQLVAREQNSQAAKSDSSCGILKSTLHEILTNFNMSECENIKD